MNSFIEYQLIEGPLKVLDLKVMHGANYFSAGKVIVIKLDLGEYDEVFSNEIPGFYEKLQKHLPSLIEHHCSVGERGGFFQRVKEGTLLGHITEHSAIELQTLAGMDVAYGKTRMTRKQGIYNVVFRFLDEVAGVYTAKVAVNLINSILLDQPFDVNEAVQNLVEIREKRLLGPSTQAIVEEAKKRNIPYLRLDEYNLVQLGTGKYHKRIRATITSDTNFIAVETVDNKVLTSLMLRNAGIPVPEIMQTKQLEIMISFQQTIQKPVVLKPAKSNTPKTICENLKDADEIKNAYNWAKKFNQEFICQQFIEGNFYRLLVIDEKFVAASKLIPPQIIGDGKQTIKQLINNLNSDRGVGDKAVLTKVHIDEITQKILSDKNYSTETILPENKILSLKISGNMKFGGLSENVTDEVHPMNKFMAERAAKVIGLNVAGIDIIAPDLIESILENNGFVIGINAAPDFRMHLKPTIGEPRNVAENLVNMLFPQNEKTRIPIFSITGTKGKTLAVNLITNCLNKAGYLVGKISSDGLFIGDNCLMKGDMTHPESVSLVLKDPTIEAAVLETSRAGILNYGLGYEFADFGIVLNLEEENIEDDLLYLEDVAYAKSVVAEQVYDEGYTILNADYEMIEEMRKRLYSNLILISKSYQNESVGKHSNKGGTSVVLADNKVVILKGSKRIELLALSDLSENLKMELGENHEILLSVAAALFAFGIPKDIIVESLCKYTIVVGTD